MNQATQRRATATGYGLLAMALAVLASSCSSGNEELKPDPVKKAMIGMSDAGPSDRYPLEGLRVRAFDLNRDNAADLWKVFAEEKTLDALEPTIKLVRKEVDSNFDGKPDVWFHYNAHERLFREEADSNFDGFVDLVSYYEKGRLQKREVFKANAAVAHAVKTYANGRLVKIELDDDSDGTTERWEIYGDGRLVQIGHDADGDGRVDYWDNRE